MKIFFNVVVLMTTIVGGALALEVESVKGANSNITINDNVGPLSIMNTIESKEVTIKDGGIERTLIIPLDKKIGTRSVNKDGKLMAKKGLIIDFIDKNITTDAFETIFNLKLKEKLMIGYFIFENQSDLSDIELIESILKWDNDNHMIKTIRPNWKMEMKKY